MSSTFSHSLRTGDKVFDAELKRSGLVHSASEKKRAVKVIFDGNTNAKKRDITTLRYWTPGAPGPEEEAPYVGELPPVEVEIEVKVPPVCFTALDALREEREANKKKILEHEAAAQRFRDANKRIETAMAALQVPA